MTCQLAFADVFEIPRDNCLCVADLGWERPIAVVDFINALFWARGQGAASVDGLPGYSFARAGEGYALRADGTYQLFASGVPRIVSGLGLLVEMAATNVYTRFAPTVAQLSGSNNISNAAEPANPPIAGLNWLVRTAGLVGFAYVPGTVAASTTYRASVIVETPDGSQPVLGPNDTTGDFRMIVGGAATASDIRYKMLSGNCWRVSATYTTSASPTAARGISWSTTHNTRDLKFTGFQCEVGTLESSPIITTGSAVTRPADAMLFADLGIRGPVALLAEAMLTGGGSGVLQNSRGLASLSEAASNDRLALYNPSGVMGGLVIDGGATQGISSVTGALAPWVTTKTAMLARDGRIIAARDGVLGNAVTGAITIPEQLDRLAFGTTATGGQPNAFIRRAAIWRVPPDTPDSFIQSLAQ